MSTRVSYIELMKMPLEDLRRDTHAQDLQVRKLRMGVQLGKEKDTAQYRRERLQLARMKTALTQKTGDQSKTPPVAEKTPAKKTTLRSTPKRSRSAQ